MEVTTDAADDVTPDVAAVVTRLRRRGCWETAAALLAQPARNRPGAALLRATVLVEATLFTHDGWSAAVSAVAHAEDLTRERETGRLGEVFSERGLLEFARTRFGGEDRGDAARNALARAAGLVPKGSGQRAWLDFRQGAVYEFLDSDPVAAWAAYENALTVSTATGDDVLLSYIHRHMASLHLASGELEATRRNLDEALRLREHAGFAVAIAPILVALAEVSEAAEAAALRVEAARWVRAFGGTPVWLRHLLQLSAD